ncbi:MAG TPA: PilZ domain-containing protein [Nitrospinota bacterium]|nr:PilZ domain-containing protein [Nitrospinota bacterium]
MEKIEQKERRRAPRTVLGSALVDLYSHEKPSIAELRGKICDISRVGIKFSSNKSYIEESIIDLDLLLPNFIQFANIFGRVVRCEQKDNAEFYTAVEFEEDLYRQFLVENYIRIMKLWDEQFNRL